MSKKESGQGKKESNWESKMLNQIEETVSSWKKRKKKKFNIVLLKRIVTRVEEFSKECKECEENQKMLVERMIELLPKIIKNRKDRLEFQEKKRLVLKHLQLDHKLVISNYYTSVGMILTSFIAVIWWWSEPYIALLWVLGGGFLGAIQDYRMEKKGRVI